MAINEPGFYISMTTSLLFIISEILPFVKNKSYNGLLQALVHCLSKKKEEIEKEENVKASKTVVVPIEEDDKITKEIQMLKHQMKILFNEKQELESENIKLLNENLKIKTKNKYYDLELQERKEENKELHSEIDELSKKLKSESKRC